MSSYDTCASASATAMSPTMRETDSEVWTSRISSLTTALCRGVSTSACRSMARRISPCSGVMSTRAWWRQATQKETTDMEATGEAQEHHTIITFSLTTHRALHVSAHAHRHRPTSVWTSATMSSITGAAKDAMEVKA